jgi:hypothetical protein
MTHPLPTMPRLPARICSQMRPQIGLVVCWLPLVGLALPAVRLAAAELARPDRGAGVEAALVEKFQERNGGVFADWPKPRAVLVLTGELDGYIEPCGCTGKENQKGGLSRRRNFLQALEGAGWEVVPLDLGGQVKRFGRQTEAKFQSIVDGLRSMRYQAVGFGPGDLRLPAEELVAAVAAIGAEPTPYVSANVGLLGLDAEITPRFRVIEAGGLKIGVTTVLGDEEAAKIRNDDIEVVPAAQALAAAAAELAKAGCDHQVLLSWAGPELGHKGMFAVAIGLTGDPAAPFRSQRVPLDARWGEADDMIALLATYQQKLETMGLAGLGLVPIRHPTGRRFAGSAACAECHQEAFEVWENSGHAKALTTLEEAKPRRDGDPECLSCHVVGWAPQRFEPFEGGFVGMEKTPHLAHQGCENCHGPAAAHTAVERGDVRATEAERDRLRAEIKLSLATPEGKQKAVNNCLECHDLDNSPQFDFDEYWPSVAH